MNQNKYYLILALTLITYLSLFTACTNDHYGTPTLQQENYGVIIERLSSHIMTSKLGGMITLANSQAISAKHLPMGSGLSDSKNLWLNLRDSWKQTEGFHFGPIVSQGFYEDMDTWPVDRMGLEDILAGNAELNSSFISNLDGNLKGFHTIEYLLWGSDGTKTTADLTPREIEYLIAVTEVFEEDANALRVAIRAFSDDQISAGMEGSSYSSQKEVLKEFADGMYWLADELANNKMGTPLSTEDILSGESPFSDNSKNDFMDNIQSIEYIYYGVWDDGLTTVVRPLNPELDERVKGDFEAAEKAVKALPDSFNAAIPANSASRVKADNAQAAVQKLKNTLIEVTEFIANL